MRVRLLGAVAVVVDGDEQRLGGARQRAVLARLALSGNTTVSTDRLIEDLWGDDPPKTARNSVQRFVSDIRRSLGNDGDRLEAVPGGYRLALGPGELDVADVEREAGLGLAEDVSIDSDAYAHLTTALGRFDGDVLDGIGDVGFAVAERARLDELRLALLEARIDADIAGGRHAAVVGELEQLTAAHPFRERLWGQLMVALYRDGRQAEALRTFQELRRVLGEELGIDPSEELQALEQRMLLQEEDASLGLDDLAEADPFRGYVLGDPIGTGPTSTVYRAQQPGTDRDVAIKVIERDVADEPTYVRDFSSLVRAVTHIEHPHVVPVHDAWREPGRACIVMRLMEGGALADRDGDAELPPAAETALWSALQAAHRQGVVHGALHDRNVLFDAGGEAYLTDFGAHGLDGRPDSDIEQLGALLDPNGMSSPSVAEGTANPYKGLSAFQEADSADFFGRDTAVAQLVERVAQRRFVTVVGPSGIGKSSVVRAGLVPALRQGAIDGSRDWYVVDMVPGTAPFASLATALEQVAVGSTEGLVSRLAESPEGLVRSVNELLPDDRGDLVVLVDQFEELFALTATEAVRRRFIDGLVRAVTDPGSRIRVVATLRADFFDRPLGYPELGELVRAGTEPVAALRGAELERAITGPAGRAGLTLSPELVARIMADVSEQAGSLPLLQYTLTQLVDSSESTTLTVADYERIGGVVGSLTQQAELAIEGMPVEDERVLSQVLLRLVNPGEDADTRRRVPMSELEAVSIESGVARRVLDALADRRLLTFDRDAKSRERTVEVAHEALLTAWPRLRGWLDDHRDGLRVQRRVATAAAAWRRASGDEGFLLTGSQLDQLDETVVARGLPLTDGEQEYVDASRVARQAAREAERERAEHELELERRARRRLRAIAVVLAAAAVLGVVLTLVAVQASRTAADERDEAQAVERLATARRLAASAGVALASDPDLSLLLALEAADLRIDAGEPIPPEVVSVLRQALDAQRTLHVIAPAAAATFADNDALVVVGGPDELGRVVDAGSGELVAELVGHRAPIAAVAASPDGRFLATGSVDGEARLWDPATGLGLVTMRGHEGPVEALAFALGGDHLVTGSLDGTYRLWDTGSGEQLAIQRVGSFVAPSAVFTLDGTQLLVTSQASSLGPKALGLDPGSLAIVEGTAADNNACAVSHDTPNDWTLVGRDDAGIAVYDESATVTTLRGHGAAVCAIDSDPETGRFISGADDASILMWSDATPSARSVSIVGHAGAIQTATLARGAELAVTSSADGTARVWDATELGPGELAAAAVPAESQRLSVVFTPDGEGVVAAGAGLFELDADTGELRREALVQNEIFRRGVAVSQSGDRWVTNDLDTALVFDPATGERGARLFDVLVADVAFAPDGALVGVTTVEGAPYLWDPETGEVAELAASAEGEAATDPSDRAVAFSPDGELLVSTTVDDRVGVWDVSTLEHVRSLGTPGGAIASIDVEAGLVAVAARSAGVTVWELSSGNLVTTLPVASEALSVALSPDAAQVAVGEAGGELTVWDLSSGSVAFSVPGATAITGLDVSPDGSRLASIDVNGGVRVRVLDTEVLVELARTRIGRTLTDAECRQYLPERGCS